MAELADQLASPHRASCACRRRASSHGRRLPAAALRAAGRWCRCRRAAAGSARAACRACAPSPSRHLCDGIVEPAAVQQVEARRAFDGIARIEPGDLGARIVEDLRVRGVCSRSCCRASRTAARSGSRPPCWRGNGPRGCGRSPRHRRASRSATAPRPACAPRPARRPCTRSRPGASASGTASTTVLKNASAPSLAGTANSDQHQRDRRRPTGRDWPSASPARTSSSTVSTKTGTTMPSQPVLAEGPLDEPG